MNPKYRDGTEAHLHNIVVVHKYQCLTINERVCWVVKHDEGYVLAEVIDFYPENKKCFKIRYIDDKKVDRRSVNSVKLADYRDIVTKN